MYLSTGLQIAELTKTGASEVSDVMILTQAFTLNGQLADLRSQIPGLRLMLDAPSLRLDLGL